MLAVGCTSRQQKQDASDAVAGITAIERVAPAEAGPVADGARHYTAAAVQTKLADLPPPTRTPSVILQDKKAYADAGKQAEDDATSGTFWAWLGGGVLGLIGVLKLWPGAHQPFVGLVQGLLENSVDRKARQKEESLAKGARTLIDAIEKYGTSEIKQYVAKKVPSHVKDAVDEYLAKVGG